MQAKQTQTSARSDGTLSRAARTVGRWLSRVINAIVQPNERSEADHWADWPRFPPF
jgi:hypothetical protein